MADLSARYPETNRNGHATVLSYRESELHPFVRARVQGVLALLSAVVALLLLLTCANVAGLILARASAREHEFGLRLTLGATRLRLIRQMLAESSLFALVAGLAGCWLFTVLFAVLLSGMGDLDMPLSIGRGLSKAALALTPLVALSTVLFFGLMPSLAVARRSVAVGLLTWSTRPGPSSHHLRQGLLAAQIASSVALLMGAGLVLRSLENLETVDLGFNPENQVIASFDLDVHGYDEARGRAFYRDLRDRLRALPDVGSVGLSTILPLNFDRSIALVWPEAWEAPDGQAAFVSRSVVDGGFFEAMEVPLRQGRVFSESGLDDTGSVMIVNEEFARRYWGGLDPLGREVRVNSQEDGPVHEVAGVVADGKYLFVGEPPQPHFYLPYTDAYVGKIHVHVRTHGPPDMVYGPLRRIVRELDPTLPVYNLTTMRKQVGFALLPSRVTAWSVSIFALLALLLTAIGLYGLVAYAVSQRTRELGIRMALGAGAGVLVLRTVRWSMGMTAVGIPAGLGVGLLGSWLLSRVLYQVSPLDPLVTCASIGVTCSTVLLASYLPARRITRIQPVRAINQE
jgi:predicted permease